MQFKRKEATGPAHTSWFGLTAFISVAIVIIVLAAATADQAAPSLAAGQLCSPSRPHAAGTTIETVATDSGSRSYRLHVPPSYTGVDQVALVLAFHGLGSNALEQEIYSGLSTRADEPDAGSISVYPDGLQLGGSGPQYWNSMQIRSPEPDDVAFIDTLLDVLEEQLCVDASRVYSTGNVEWWTDVFAPRLLAL